MLCQGFQPAGWQLWPPWICQQHCTWLWDIESKTFLQWLQRAGQTGVRFVLPPAASLLTSAVPSGIRAHWNSPAGSGQLCPLKWANTPLIYTGQGNGADWDNRHIPAQPLDLSPGIWKPTPRWRVSKGHRKLLQNWDLFFYRNLRQSAVVIQLVPIWIQNSRSWTVRPSFPLFIRAIKQ